MRIDKDLATTFKAQPGGREVIATISTTSVDRDGDVMLPSGLDLANFNKLPTVLMTHDQQRLPVARVPPGGVRKMPDAVQAKAIMLDRPPSLPANIEWPPDTLLDLFKQGAPLGFSVGFRIKDARQPTQGDKRRFPGAQRVITQWELLEFSVVPIPANQDALLVAVSKCAKDPSPWMLGALGLRPKAKVTVKPPKPRRLRIDMGHIPGERLRI